MHVLHGCQWYPVTVTGVVTLYSLKCNHHWPAWNRCELITVTIVLLLDWWGGLLVKAQTVTLTSLDTVSCIKRDECQTLHDWVLLSFTHSYHSHHISKPQQYQVVHTLSAVLGGFLSHRAKDFLSCWLKYINFWLRHIFVGNDWCVFWLTKTVPLTSSQILMLTPARLFISLCSLCMVDPKIHHDTTFVVDWALKTNYLSVLSHRKIRSLLSVCFFCKQDTQVLCFLHHSPDSRHGQLRLRGRIFITFHLECVAFGQRSVYFHCFYLWVTLTVTRDEWKCSLFFVFHWNYSGSVLDQGCWAFLLSTGVFNS